MSISSSYPTNYPFVKESRKANSVKKTGSDRGQPKLLSRPLGVVQQTIGVGYTSSLAQPRKPRTYVEQKQNSLSRFSQQKGKTIVNKQRTSLILIRLLPIQQSN